MIKISGEQVNLENTLDIDEKTILENIKDIILKKNDWMEIQEIVDILGVKFKYSTLHRLPRRTLRAFLAMTTPHF